MIKVQLPVLPAVPHSYFLHNYPTSLTWARASWQEICLPICQFQKHRLVPFTVALTCCSQASKHVQQSVIFGSFQRTVQLRNEGQVTLASSATQQLSVWRLCKITLYSNVNALIRWHQIEAVFGSQRLANLPDLVAMTIDNLCTICHLGLHYIGMLTGSPPTLFAHQSVSSLSKDTVSPIRPSCALAERYAIVSAR